MDESHAIEAGVEAATDIAIQTSEEFVRALSGRIPRAWEVYDRLLKARGPEDAPLSMEDMRDRQVAKDILEFQVKLLTGPAETKELVRAIADASTVVSEAMEKMAHGILGDAELTRLACQFFDAADMADNAIAPELRGR